jgi:adenosylcobinamide-phosphate synthase
MIICYSSSWLDLFTIKLVVLILALFLDVTFGELPSKFHPTVWMGKVISFWERKIREKNLNVKRVDGVWLALASIFPFALLFYIFLILCWKVNLILYIIFGSFLLKSTFAIKSMGQHVTPIIEAINGNNLNESRKLVSRIVSRNTEKLNEKQVISATVESVAEGTVDGIVSPIFYFTFFGVIGAIVYRVINTLDSMVGYKDNWHLNIGWFSAKLDTLVNFLPARIAAYLMILTTLILRMNWKNALEILRRDKSKTESLNAGWPMSVVAGALNIQLEKPGVYILGEKKSELSTDHIYLALSIMKVTVILFILLFAIPVMLLMSILGFHQF